ncbi:hypothetical protein IWX47DRAFT_849193 [Phyllosticta citricarpa]|uniref:Uncharacterized protein n=1 Tax=Phyllosticta citricarpa TaxID=55181 RepID=A0ABR1LVI8_9PEZI
MKDEHEVFKVTDHQLEVANYNYPLLEQSIKESQVKSNPTLDSVQRHFESTVPALIGVMSIIESRKAIKHAEEVTKLTQLAFFFIPLNFVVGIFGMNFEELPSDGTWTWAVTSVRLLVATYLISYY